MKKIIFAVAIVIALLAAGWYLTRAEIEPESGAPKSSENTDANLGIPDITVQDLGGNKINLPELAGQPLVINSWAAWCPFCIDELPDFAQAQKDLGGAVKIVAINRTESAATSVEYTNKLNVSGDLTFLLDPKDSFYAAIGGFSMPETLFINSDGTINFHKRGVMQLEEIKQRISELK